MNPNKVGIIFFILYAEQIKVIRTMGAFFPAVACHSPPVDLIFVRNSPFTVTRPCW